MAPHPLRLLLVCYSLAGLAAVFVPGLTTLQALLLFWFGGAGFVMTAVTLPGLRGAFTRELVLSPNGRSENEEYQLWDEDIAMEALVPAKRPKRTRQRELRDDKRNTG